MKRILFITILALLMVSMTATSAVPSDTQATFFYREMDASIRSIAVKGNTSDSRLEFLANQVSATRQMTRAIGSPDIAWAEQNLTVRGDVTGTFTIGYRVSNSLYQKDSYFPNYAVDKVVRTHDHGVTVNNYTHTLDAEFYIRQTYTFMEDNTSFTKILLPERGLTVFINRGGYLYPFPVFQNQELLGYVVGYHVKVTVLVFDTASQTMLGYHMSEESGHGNKLPRNTISYLRNNSIVPRFFTPNKIRGNATLADIQKNTEWLPLGYNETLGLDTYLAVFKADRHSLTLAVRAAPADLGLAAADSIFGMESIIDQYATPNENADLSIDSVDAIESEFTASFLTEDNVVLDNTTARLSLPMISLIVSAFIAIGLLRRGKQI